MIKSILEKLASILMYPWRKAYRKRNGICVQENRHEIPNDIFLGLVSEKLAEGHTAIIWVKGYSMRPFIEYGRDRVKLAFPKELHAGDAVLTLCLTSDYGYYWQQRNFARRWQPERI